MNVIFIDDEWESYIAICTVIEHHYASQNVTKFKSAHDALDYVRKQPLSVDLAIIDEVLTGDFNGIKLGRALSELAPYISLVMLTGHASLDLCKNAMRAGFQDFLDKSSDILPAEKFLNLLKQIDESASVRAKLNLKREAMDLKYKLQTLKVELNKTQLQVPFAPARRRQDPTSTVARMLAMQEQALKIAHEATVVIDGDTLAMAILMLEKDMPLNAEIMNDLKMHKPEVSLKKYGIDCEKPRAKVGMRFQFFNADVINPAGIEAYQLLSTKPHDYAHSIRKARNRSDGQRQMETFIDELVNTYMSEV